MCAAVRLQTPIPMDLPTQGSYCLTFPIGPRPSGIFTSSAAVIENSLQARLSAQGVGTLIHYPIPPHRQAAYDGLGFAEGAFPLASRLAEEVLSLPIGPHVSREQAEAVIAHVMHAYRS